MVYILFEMKIIYISVVKGWIRIRSNMNHNYIFTLFCVSDLFWPVLRGGESVQAVAHLHREDYRDLQGQEEARGPASRLCHHRHCLQVIGQIGNWFSTW